MFILSLLACAFGAAVCVCALKPFGLGKPLEEKHSVTIKNIADAVRVLHSAGSVRIFSNQSRSRISSRVL
jgi:hypothetical protein